jgi:lipoprotein|nr:MAG TPA: Sporulation related domain [Bacteriophage sp.]
MKRNLLWGAVLCAVVTMTSCKSSESAYKKAYEKAKAQERARVSNTSDEGVATVTPMVEQPATQPTMVENTDNVPVRTENLSIVNGAGLNNFSVVVGSFSLKANAEGLQNRLKASGYAAQLGYNAERNMYRVIATTFSDKASAVTSRDQLRATYPDAWLLFKK